MPDLPGRPDLDQLRRQARELQRAAAMVPADLTHWEASLAGRPDVTIRVYNADNHLFFRGTGKSTRAEYEPAQHVDPAVVADIADWLLTTAGA